MRNAKEAERLTKQLAARGATLVVAFGSFARGDWREGSDLDLIAVMKSELSFIKRLDELYTELVPQVPLDLLVYTPEEFEEIKTRPFIKRALSEGYILHAA